MKIFPWQNLRYFINTSEWDFMPPEHRPPPLSSNYSRLEEMSHEEYVKLGARFYHDDWFWPFSKIPRTWTSFEFDTAGTSTDRVYWDNKQNLFEWKGEVYMKPWVPQVTHVFWKGGHGIYWCFDLFGYRWRFGPRVTDDLENGPGYCYVDYIPLPLVGWILNCGIKKL